MKKIFYTIIFAVAVLAVASCNKENLDMTAGDEAAPVMEVRTLVAVQGESFKTTTSDDIHIKWEKGDSIKVFDNYQNAYKFVADSAGFTTTFTGEVPSDATLKSAVYPYCATAKYVAKGNGGFSSFIPDTQDGKFSNVILGGVMANDGRTMKFTAVTSVIKMSVPDTANVQKITVYSKNVLAGSFEASNSSNAWTVTISSTESEKFNLLTVKAPKGGKLSGDVFITLFATTKAPDLAFTFYNPVKHGKKAKTLSNPLVQNRITDLGVAKINYTLSNGAFTVDAEGHQVYFTKGNLQYQPSTKTWRLAENSYDFVGGIADNKPYGTVYIEEGGEMVKCDNTKISDSYTGWVDLLAYGATGYSDDKVNYSPTNYLQNNLSHDYASADLDEHSDWGRYCTIQGAPSELQGKMRVLTEKEWDYLATREPLRFENKEPWYFTTKMGHAIIVPDEDNTNTVLVYGMVLLPEVFDDPETSLINGGKFLPRGISFSGYYNNCYTREGWSAMEKNGAIILPAGGMRGGYTVNAGFPWSINTGTSGIIGNYWTSNWAKAFNKPNKVLMTASHIEGPQQEGVFVGCSVRLVWDAPFVTVQE